MMVQCSWPICTQHIPHARPFLVPCLGVCAGHSQKRLAPCLTSRARSFPRAQSMMAASPAHIHQAPLCLSWRWTSYQIRTRGHSSTKNRLPMRASRTLELTLHFPWASAALRQRTSLQNRWQPWKVRLCNMTPHIPKRSLTAYRGEYRA